MEVANKHFSVNSFAAGALPTAADVEVLEALTKSSLYKTYPNVARYVRLVQSYTIKERAAFPAAASAMVKSLISAAASASVPGPMKQEATSHASIDVDTLKDKMLRQLDVNGSIADTLEFAALLGVPHADVVEAKKALLAHSYVTAEVLEHSSWKLTADAGTFKREGSPEMRVFNAVSADGLDVSALASTMGDAKMAKVGMSNALKGKWLRIDKSGGSPRLFRAAESVDDSLLDLIAAAEKSLSSLDKETEKVLKQRKLIVKSTVKSFKLGKGEKFKPTFAKQHADLTQEMIASGDWQKVNFKPLRFDVDGRAPSSGFLHPLLKVREEFRSIFLEFGFSEMPTNRFVESAFWNFDALFQPQAHPARDAHDTFFCSRPKNTLTIPGDYMARVKKMHEEGDLESRGWRYDWQESEARKNILRTHTTAISSRMLYKLAQDGFKPTKLFSIDRVFRNERLDATHLAEFHQIEGVVCAKNLGLADLMGLIKLFFERMGLHDIRFKPAYNPYTEPSMEIFYAHPDPKVGLMEIGNSGMFRPEMLRPMGLPEDTTVAAWGLGLERPTMIKYGIRNIRELFGAQVKFDNIKQNPIVRLDK